MPEAPDWTMRRPGLPSGRGWKAAFRDAPVYRRAAECRDARHIAQTVEGWRGLGRVRLGKGLVKKHEGFLDDDPKGCSLERPK